MLSFLEFDFKYIVCTLYIHAFIPALNKYMLSAIKLPAVSHLKSEIYIHYSSEKCKH